MKMKTLLPMFALLLASNIYAGDKGHGGGGHSCGDTVELYDFYEGRSPILHGIDVWETDPTLSVEEYIKKAMGHLKQDVPYIGQFIESKVKDLFKTPYKELVLPVLIPRTLDADLPLLDEGCEFKQVASWNERFEKVFFSRSVFEKMDNMSKAGLYVHEILYKIARNNKLGQNSDGIRKLVAEIFSDSKLDEIDLEKLVTPADKLAIIPKTGICELSIKVEWKVGEEYESHNLSSIDPVDYSVFFGAIGSNVKAEAYPTQPTIFKEQKYVSEAKSVPCASIYEKGLTMEIVYETPTKDSFLNLFATFFVNGRKISTGSLKSKDFEDDLLLRSKIRKKWYNVIFPENILEPLK